MNEGISLIELCMILRGLLLSLGVQILLWTVRHLNFAFLLILNQYPVKEEGKEGREGRVYGRG